MIELNFNQTFDYPLPEVFDFFSKAQNLETLTPEFLHFKILTPEPITMAPGLLIDYRLKLHGIPFKWQSEITEWNPPYYFIDEQRKGPYRVWKHNHQFSSLGDKTVVADHIQYSVWGGQLVNRLFVAPDIKKIFKYRQEKLKSIFV